jgi:hypothetical protein
MATMAAIGVGATFDRGTAMTRVSWLTTLVLGAAFVFLFVSTREGSTYNVLLQENNSNKLFCLPSDSVVTVQQAEEIINHVSQRLANPDDVPISLLLVIGLQEEFPCS